LLGVALDEAETVGEVWGKGLMIGIELDKDRDSKEPFGEMASQVRTECFKRGVVIEVGGHFGNVARFLPPLVITEELMRKGTEIFLDAVQAAEIALTGSSAALAGI
jgi:diaminobutyrate-2-oxoglutarate transaminase